MKTFLVQSLASLATGLLTGFLFAWLRLPIPGPTVIPAVIGILGITLGFLLYQKLFG